MNIPHPKKFKRSNFKKPTKSSNNILHIKLPVLDKLISNDDIEIQKSDNVNKTINHIPNQNIAKTKKLTIKNTNKFHNISYLDFNNPNDQFSKKHLKHSYTVMNYEDIVYLNRKSEQIQIKIKNEFQAQEYIDELKKEIKKKEELRNKIIKEIHNIYRKKDDNKIQLSLDLDSRMETLNNLKEKLEKSYKKSKLSLLNNTNIYYETDSKAKIIELEMYNLINNNKENDEKFSKIGEDFYNEYLTLNNQIIQLENELKENIESGIKYYLLLLNKGNDTRKIGLSWIVRRLLKLKYEPSLKDFPKTFDEKMAKFIIELAKKQNENVELIEQLKRMKDDMISNQNKYENKSNKKKISGLKEEREKHLYEKLEKLLEKHEYYYIPPQQENKIQICLHTPNIKQYKIRIKETDNLNFAYIKNRSATIKSRAHSASSSFGWKYNSIIFNEKKFSNGKIKDLKSIIDIKKKIEMNEYIIEKLKIEQYNYLREKKERGHSLLEINLLKNDNLMKALFGTSTIFNS